MLVCKERAYRDTGQRQGPPLRGTGRRAGPQLRRAETHEPTDADRRQVEVAFGEYGDDQPVGVEDGRQRGKVPHDPEGSEADVSFAATPASKKKGSEGEKD